MRFIGLCVIVVIGMLADLPAQQLKVVTRDIEPFSFEKNGRRQGFAALLWDNVAQELKLDYAYTSVGTAKEMVEAVQSQTADVAVGALSITAEREKVIDFSQPFYESGLQIAVTQQEEGIGSIIGTIFRNLITWKLVIGVAVALFIMFLISHFVWLYEHRINEEMWPRNYWQGMGESFWWTLSIFLVGGADNKGPVGMGGRIVATIWMLASVIAVSLLTASLSAVITVNSLSGDIKGPEDLPNKKVATVKGSTAETWLAKLGSDSGGRVAVVTFANARDCLAALKNGEVKAVVYDAPVLKYYLKKMADDELTLVKELFERNNYGFGLQQDSPLRERINQVLLNLNENGVAEDLKVEYFGK